MCGLKAYYFDLAFQLARQTRPLVGISLIGATLNLVLNLLWIPRYGMFGAAWATVTTFVMALFASAILGRRYVTMPLPWVDWGKIAAVSIVLGSLLHYLPRPSGPVLALGLPIVAGLLLVAIAFFALDVAGVRTWLRSSRRARVEV
jgi:O-antigen/teichoic acid export membrane protein